VKGAGAYVFEHPILYVGAWLSRFLSLELSLELFRELELSLSLSEKNKNKKRKGRPELSSWVLVSLRLVRLLMLLLHYWHFVALSSAVLSGKQQRSGRLLKAQ
jgi:hypothetical protein